MTYEIRTAKPSDSLGISVVHAYTWLTAYSGLIPQDLLLEKVNNAAQNTKIINQRIETDNNYIAAVSDGVIIGFASIGKSRNPDFEDYGEINALYVLQAFHKQSVGKALFAYASKLLKAQGFTKLIVNCLKGNKNAMGFYAAMGGQKCGERHDTLKSGLVIY